MKIANHTKTVDGKIHITLENKVGYTFNDESVVRQVANDAIRRLGNEARAAIAIIRAKDDSLIGYDLADVLRVEE